ncbi:LacI family DNA-binding transcriptional regulator [Bacillus velezensis]
MATIRDIVYAAGVSVTTVSRVLNDHPYVSKDKRERVKKRCNRSDTRATFMLFIYPKVFPI